MQLFRTISLLCFLLLTCSIVNAQNATLFPGDVNNNGIANNVDLLYIGSAFGAMGFARTNYEINISASVSGGTPPYSYQWTNSDGSSSQNLSPFFVLEDPGAYISCVTITDVQGLTTELCQDYVVGNASQDCNLQIITTIDSFNIVQAQLANTNGIADVFWDLGGMNINDETAVFSNLAEGNYSLCVNTVDLLGGVCNQCVNIVLGTPDTGLSCALNIEQLAPIFPSVIWGEQNLPLEWNGFFSPELNYAYADCDGDGLINEADLNVLEFNYDFTHFPILVDSFEQGNANFDPIFALQNNPDTSIIQAGASVELPIILGSPNLPLDDFYGSAFSIDYDTAFIKEGSVNIQFFQNAWINNDNGGLISIQRDKYNDGTIEAAISRINQLPIDGYGEIGKVSFIIEDDLVNSLQMGNVLQLEMQKTRVVDAFLNEQIVANGRATFVIDTLSNIKPVTVENIRIYPNPTVSVLLIETQNLPINDIKIFDVAGQLYTSNYTQKNDYIELTLDAIPSGIYFVKIRTDKQIITKKIIIQKS